MMNYSKDFKDFIVKTVGILLLIAIVLSISPVISIENKIENKDLILAHGATEDIQAINVEDNSDVYRLRELLKAYRYLIIRKLTLINITDLPQELQLELSIILNLTNKDIDEIPIVDIRILLNKAYNIFNELSLHVEKRVKPDIEITVKKNLVKKLVDIVQEIIIQIDDVEAKTILNEVEENIEEGRLDKAMELLDLIEEKVSIHITKEFSLNLRKVVTVYIVLTEEIENITIAVDNIANSIEALNMSLKILINTKQILIELNASEEIINIIDETLSSIEEARNILGYTSSILNVYISLDLTPIKSTKGILLRGINSSLIRTEIELDRLNKTILELKQKATVLNDIEALEKLEEASYLVNVAYELLKEAKYVLEIEGNITIVIDILSRIKVSIDHAWNIVNEVVMVHGYRGDIIVELDDLWEEIRELALRLNETIDTIDIVSKVNNTWLQELLLNALEKYQELVNMYTELNALIGQEELWKLIELVIRIELSIEEIEEILDTIDDIVEEYYEALDEIIEFIEEFKEKLKDINETISELYEEALELNSSNALTLLGEVRNITKLIGELISELEEAVNEWNFTRIGLLINRIEQLFDETENILSEIEEILEKGGERGEDTEDREYRRRELEERISELEETLNELNNTLTELKQEAENIENKWLKNRVDELIRVAYDLVENITLLLKEVESEVENNNLDRAEEIIGIIEELIEELREIIESIRRIIEGGG